MKPLINMSAHEIRELLLKALSGEQESLAFLKNREVDGSFLAIFAAIKTLRQEGHNSIEFERFITDIRMNNVSVGKYFNDLAAGRIKTQVINNSPEYVNILQEYQELVWDMAVSDKPISLAEIDKMDNGSIIFRAIGSLSTEFLKTCADKKYDRLADWVHKNHLTNGDRRDFRKNK